LGPGPEARGIRSSDTARAVTIGQRWRVWLICGDRASGFVLERRMLAVAARADAVIVQKLVVPGAQEDEIIELGLTTTLDCDEVVAFEFVSGGAAGVLAVG
jgi:hypothetical protein